MANAKKSLSSYQLARDLELTQKTAWYMQQRIRAAMASDEGALLQGIIEAGRNLSRRQAAPQGQGQQARSWSFGQNLRRGSRPAQGRSQGRSYRRYQGRDRLGLYRAVRRAGRIRAYHRRGTKPTPKPTSLCPIASSITVKALSMPTTRPSTPTPLKAFGACLSEHGTAHTTSTPKAGRHCLWLRLSGSINHRKDDDSFNGLLRTCFA